jgi:protein-S-isoprenylcysteine O-methyltransferase Ste14
MSDTHTYIENLRKPLSRFIAFSIAGIALFTVPKQFGKPSGETMEIIGFLLLILAAFGRVWCAVYISGRKNKILCKEGPYSISRNPLYFFSLLGLLGFGFAVQSWIIALFSSLIYLALYRFIIGSEEVRLLKMFPEEYPLYINSTPRFFPTRFRVQSPDSYEINPKVIEKSLKEIVWFLLVIVIIEILEFAHTAGYLIMGHL